MNKEILSIDWGGSQLTGIAVLQQRLFTFPAGNIRLLSQEQLGEICHKIAATTAIAGKSTTWLVGAAGAGDAAARARLQAAIESVCPVGCKTVIKTDCECNHAAAFAGGDGLLSINGTGSIIFAKNGQQTVCLGGWGYILDELPSAAWFGRRALQGVLLAMHNESCSNCCLEIFRRRYGQKAQEQLIDELYCSASIQQKLGEFAPILTEAYDQGCAYATQTINEAIVHWLKFVQQAASRVKLTSPIQLCGSGGLWQGWAGFATAITAAAQQQQIPLQLCPPQAPLWLGPLFLQYPEEALNHAKQSAQ